MNELTKKLIELHQLNRTGILDVMWGFSKQKDKNFEDCPYFKIAVRKYMESGQLDQMFALMDEIRDLYGRE